MGGEKSLELISPELIDRIEKAAISAASEILSGRRIIDVEGPYGVGLTTVEVGNDELTAAVNILDGEGYRGPYGLALAPELYNNLFRRYPGSNRSFSARTYRSRIFRPMRRTKTSPSASLWF